MHREYWEAFYQARAADFVPDSPSSFARWVLPQLGERPLVEFGSGNGRDALWFAAQGRRVLGVDYAATAVAACNAHAVARGLDAAFQICDLYVLKDVLGLVEQSVTLAPDVYARFLLHALEDAGRANVVRGLSGLLEGGGRGYLEFRTDADADNQHVLEDHFRLYLDPGLVQYELEAAGLAVEECIVGTGLAPYRDEDPTVARMVIRARTAAST